MPTIEQNGTLTADGTEQTLASVLANRNLVLTVSGANMASDDRVVIRSKRKVLAASSLEQWQARSLSNAQGSLIVMDPMPSPHEAAFTLEQTAGSHKDFEYTVESL